MMMNNIVYTVWCEGKFVGFFSSEEKAKEFVEYIKGEAACFSRRKREDIYTYIGLCKLDSIDSEYIKERLDLYYGFPAK